MLNSYKPDGMPGLIPYFTVVNAERAIKFYKEAFGFEPIQIAYDDDKNINHVEMHLLDVIIMFSPEGAFNSTNKAPITQSIVMPLNLYVYCLNVDKLYEQAVMNGAKSKLAPNNGFWGDRFCTLIDLDGYEWSFANYIGN